MFMVMIRRLDRIRMILSENTTANINIKPISFETEWGTARLRKDGYYYISTKKYNGRLLHRLIYEKHYGPIPDGFCVHHVDGDKSNFELSNLVLLSKSEHQSIHSQEFQKDKHPRWCKGRIDQAGGLEFISEMKNKGMNMQAIADELGYSNVSSVFHYLNARNVRWNQI